MRVFRSVVQALMLPVVYSFEDLFHSSTVASQLVRHDNPWRSSLWFEQFTEEFVGGPLIPASLHQDVKHLSVLVDGSPQVVLFAVDFHLYFVQMPLISWHWTSATQLIGIELSKLVAPGANCFVSQSDSAIEHHLLYISVAKGECVIEPHAVGDDLGGKAMTLVSYAHPLSLAQSGSRHR